MIFLSRLRSQLGVGLFLLALSLPALDWLLDLDRAPQPNENRRAAEWPVLPSDAKSLRHYLSNLELYYNDHFGYRKQLIRWNNRWRKSFFRDLSGVDVVRGKEGWMFFSCCYMVDHLLGTRPYDPGTLQKLKSEFEARASFLARRGIAYTIVIAPDKETIYPEYLPDWLASQISQPTKIDQFLSYMQEQSAIPIVDLRPALIQAKELGALYHHTDSHWNSLGAFVATQEIVRALHKQNLRLPEPLSLGAMDIQPGECPGGDLARMVDQTAMLDPACPSVSPKPPVQAVQLIPDPGIAPGRNWPQAALPEYSENPAQKKRLLVFRDSFGGAMQSHLGLLFGRVAHVFLYLWSYQDSKFVWAPEIIDKEKPDAVIDEIVGRALLNLNTDKIVLTDFSQFQ